MHRLILGAALAAGAAYAVPAQELEALRVYAPSSRKAEERAEFRGESVSIPRTRSSTLSTLLFDAPAAHSVGGESEAVAPAVQLRGFDPWQTSYLLEDVVVRDGLFPSSAPSWIPLSAFSEAEVFAGGSPARFATEGLGGAIRYRLPRDCPRPNAQLRGGSFGAASIGANACGGRSLRAAIRYARADERYRYFDSGGTPLDDSDDGFGKRLGQDFSQGSLLLSADPSSTTRLFSLHGLREQGIAGSVQSVPLGRVRAQHHLAVLRHEPTQGPLQSLTFHAGFDREVRTDAGVANPFLPNTLQQTHAGTYARFGGPLAEGVTVGASMRGRWDGVQLSVPGNGRRQRFEAPVSGEVAWGFFPGWQAHAASVVFPASLSDGATSRTFLVPSPRGAVVFRPDSLSEIRLSGGRFARLPSLFESFGTPGGLVANPSLRPELASRIELASEKGWRWRGGFWRGISLSASASAAEAKDVVALLPSGPAILRAENVDRATFVSGELAAEVRAAGALRLRTSAVWLEAKNRSDAAAYRGKRLPQRPRFRGSSAFAWEADAWECEYRLRWQGPTFRDLANRDEVGALTDHSVRVAARLGEAGTLSVEVANLLDTIQVERGLGAFSGFDYPGAPGFPGPGRRIYVTWSLDI